LANIGRATSALTLVKSHTAAVETGGTADPVSVIAAMAADKDGQGLARGDGNLGRRTSGTTTRTAVAVGSSAPGAEGRDIHLGYAWRHCVTLRRPRHCESTLRPYLRSVA
jgi:hypothetical protein